MGTKIKAMTTIDAQDVDGLLLELSKSQLTTPIVTQALNH